jgi:hypothetical protein
VLEDVDWCGRVTPGGLRVDSCDCFVAVEFLEARPADYGDVDRT